MSNYWLEITDRKDIGADLKIPQKNGRGGNYWGYSLILRVTAGDTILHYHKQDHAIVGISRAVGTASTAPIVWAAHGTSGRRRNEPARRQPGWLLPLSGYRPLTEPVSLETIRAAEPQIRVFEREFKQQGGKYFPFALSDKRTIRPAQSYLTPFPAELLGLLGLGAIPTVASESIEDELPGPLTPRTFRRRAAFVRESARPAYGSATVGERYRPADELAAVPNRDPFLVDPEIVDRGNQGHATTQNALADFLRGAEIEPLSSAPGEPPFDIAWWHQNVLHVGEVKSLSPKNEERQLRLGLGQLLRYRNQLSRSGGSVRGVLIAEYEPSDPDWIELCAELSLLLVWPEKFETLIGT